MKNIFILLFLSASSAMAQSSKKMIVEHFTNTRCSVCASLNPGFYTNLNNQPGDVLHITYHPSSPFANCLFSQQNKPENDARTNYYNIYGSTPKILINGTVIQVNNNYNSPMIFDPFENNTTQFSVRMSQTRSGDSIYVQTSVKRVADGGVTSLLLYGGLAEDTVNYTGSNGESRHYDVFRKAVFGLNGTSFQAPASIGDSIQFSGTVAISSIWNLSRLYAYSIIQESGNRKVVQSEALPAGSLNVTGTQEIQIPQISLYPNPVKDILVFESPSETLFKAKILDGLGRQVSEFKVRGKAVISTREMVPGMYFVVLQSEGKQKVLRFLKQ